MLSSVFGMFGRVGLSDGLQKNWAAPLRFGLLRISARDMACIAAAMEDRNSLTALAATV